MKRLTRTLSDTTAGALDDMTAQTRQQHHRLPGTPARAGSTDRSGHPDGTPSARPSPAAMRWAHGALAEAVPGLAQNVAAVRMLRDGRKRLAVLDLTNGLGSMGPKLVLKQYADDRGAWTRQWLHRIAGAGFAPPARFAVTSALGWSGTQRTLVTDLAPGRPWTHWLLSPSADRNAAAATAADWLTTLQALPVTLPDRTSHRAETELRRQSAELADHYPEHGAHLGRIVGLIHHQLYCNTRAPVPGLTPSHGDLHPNNIFLNRGDPLDITGIDIDTAGLRRPSYDVGYALAQLLIVSWMHTGAFHSGAAAGRVFWQRWATQSGRDAEAVPAEVARALIQSLHFELVTYHTERIDIIDRWLTLADTVLASGINNLWPAITTAEEATR